MNRNPILCRCFVDQAKQFLSTYPQIKHEWSIDEDQDHCILDIPEESENGFSITVEVDSDQIIVLTSGAHQNFEFNGDNPDDLVSEILGLVRDLLSPMMRIRERLSNGKPYKWAFEVYHNEQWITEEFVGLLFWNYFGKRTEKIYQNETLPAREKPFG